MIVAKRGHVMPFTCSAPVAPAPCGAPAEADGAVTAPAPFRARYLRVRDEASDGREAFVRAVFGDLACFPFADESTFALSRASADYDVLILDATDPSRMARYLRIHGPVLRNVAKFAIMQEGSPPRRARMLMAGCDDVLDTARTSPEEARMRVAAVMRRYHARWATWQEDRRLNASMARFADPNTLTPRELALLRALAKQPGRAMSAQELCGSVAPPDAAAFKRSLRFSISKLRGKLHPDWRIEPTPGEGYALSRRDAGKRAPAAQAWSAASV